MNSSITESSAIGKYSIVKFHLNNNPKSPNKILTRTFGKFGVIDKDYMIKGENLPKKFEFWKVKIISEIKPRSRNGCFVLQPIEKIEQISHLVPGMFDSRMVDAIMFVVPHHKGKPWILPLEYKKSITSVYAIIVDLEE